MTTETGYIILIIADAAQGFWEQANNSENRSLPLCSSSSASLLLPHLNPPPTLYTIFFKEALSTGLKHFHCLPSPVSVRSPPIINYEVQIVRLTG